MHLNSQKDNTKSPNYIRAFIIILESSAQPIILFIKKVLRKQLEKRQIGNKDFNSAQPIFLFIKKVLRKQLEKRQIGNKDFNSAQPIFLC
ncbi:MAG: hypothetical protein CVU84_16050 [Firmicutes bacterium HGW-Firmicutes-1]|nr:MAG: hypothetical protein CVU84_16050 [Firmicutes bacterium HGW-Firmicutes-1]